MNGLWIAFKMCMGMFTALPVGKNTWNESLRRHSTACLPLVGIVVGGIWWAVAALARWLLPEFLAAAVLAAVPFFVTGFIHLDGFMDTGDALLSWRSREERVKILKDVHTGSFAVVLMVLLAMFSFAAAMSVEKLFPLMLIPVISRAGSAYSVLALKPLAHSEYVSEDERPVALIRDVKIMAAAALVVLLVFSGWRGLLAGLAALGGYALAMRACIRSLGGVSGDLAGFALVVSEFCGLFMLAIV